jgi:cell wall-associated NlpC family hydrolase
LPVPVPGRSKARLANVIAGWLTVATLAVPSVAAADAGGAGLPPPSPPASLPQTGLGGGPSTGVTAAPVPGAVAKLAADGRTAIPPEAAPEPVKQSIYAANRITRRPYVWGGGHGSFRSRGYDCSGSVSYALHGGEILDQPLDSSDFMRWGEPGPGAWITIYTNPSHAFIVIAGLRFDTSGVGERGPRWRLEARSSRSFKARHPLGY